MKHVFILTLAAVVAVVDLPAQTVTITTLDHVSVNGGPPMPVADAYSNYKDARAAITVKVSEYESQLIGRASNAEARAQEAEDALADNVANQAAVVATAEAAQASDATIEEKLAIFMAALEQAQKLRAEREAERLAKEAEALEAEAARKRAEAEALTGN